VGILEAGLVVQRMVVEVGLYWSLALVPENEYKPVHLLKHFHLLNKYI
jgi:hypothetical protein